VTDSESAARLTSEGKVLYEADVTKKSGYQYCSLAVGLAEVGEFRRAIREASKALYLGETGRGDTCLVAMAKRDLASAYSFAGQLDRARQFATDAIQGAFGCREPATVSGPSRKILGDVSLRRGRAQEAISYYERALAESPANFQPLVRSSLGNAYLALGNLSRARSLYQEAEQQAPAAVKPLIHRGLGYIALAEGRVGDASALFEAAAATSVGSDAAYERLWALDGIARARLAAGDQVGAAAAYGQAITTAEVVRARFRSEEFKTGFFADVQQVFDGAVSSLVDSGQGEAAFAASERGRARALRDLVRGRVTAKAGTEVLAEPVAGSATAAQVASQLPQGVVLVQYHILEERSIAWVVRREGVKTISLNVGRATLTERTGQFRESISIRGTDAGPLGDGLYRLLIEPLRLAENEALVVIPHGPLHYLPFQALRGPRGYLIEERALSYAPSATVLRFLLSKDRGSRRSVLALGNPDVGSSSLALPGAEREVQQIKVLFPEAEVYVRKDATKERLLARAPQNNVVHVGAHAAVDEVDPLYSVIQLASTGSQSGELEAHEVYEMDLSKVGLVTLSACETGLGKVSRGDEIWGFTRTFFAAGARGVVVSLWPVGDVSTSRLMEKFYAGLRADSAQQALRVAQLDILRSAEYSHPFFWAAFNIEGDWR
jgi:CHAT domain-containing protein/predicted negative regulator of RcsB-dependent stress response